MASADPGAPGGDPRMQALRAALVTRVPVDDRERESLQELLAGLDRLAAPFDEHAAPVHVTASALVVGRRGVVLHRHKRLGIWLQPGGHIDPGEEPAEAARREAHEETGLAVSHPAGGPQVVHVDAHRGAKPTCERHLDVRYLLLAPDREPTPLEGESPEAQWFGLDEALAVADEGLVGGLRALRRLGLGVADA